MTTTDTEPGVELAENAGNDTSKSVSGTGGRFASGYDPRRNLAGRIKKQPTVLDELAKQAHQAKHRRKVARAWIETAEAPHTPTGQRAREALSDRLYGLPKQTLVLEQGETAAAAFLMRHNARVVDAESYVVRPAEQADDIT